MRLPRSSENIDLCIPHQVEELNAMLATLSKQFEEKTAEQQDLKQKADLMERRLVAASRLIAGLGSERSRWTADIEELESRKERLVGDCLLTSSFLSYTGAFTFVYRHKMVYDMWQNDLLERVVPVTQVSACGWITWESPFAIICLYTCRWTRFLNPSLNQSVS